MAVEQPGFTYSFVAAADLSSSAFRWVKLDSSGNVILCAAVTDKPIGILQNDPKNAQEATVMLAGVSKLSSSAALAVDALVGTDANGQGAAYVPGTDTTKYIPARVISDPSANVNELTTVVFDCMSIGGLRGA